HAVAEPRGEHNELGSGADVHGRWQQPLTYCRRQQQCRVRDDRAFLQSWRYRIVADFHAVHHRYHHYNRLHPEQTSLRATIVARIDTHATEHHREWPSWCDGTFGPRRFPAWGPCVTGLAPLSGHKRWPRLHSWEGPVRRGWAWRCVSCALASTSSLARDSAR